MITDARVLAFVGTTSATAHSPTTATLRDERRDVVELVAPTFRFRTEHFELFAQVTGLRSPKIGLNPPKSGQRAAAES